MRFLKLFITLDLIHNHNLGNTTVVDFKRNEEKNRMQKTSVRAENVVYCEHMGLGRSPELRNGRFNS